jgi:urease accessory protein
VLDRPLQRSHGSGRLSVKQAGGATRIDRLHQAANAKIRIPKTRGGALEAVLINTAGGICGGDTLSWTVQCGANTSAVVTTQACERAYDSSGETARQTVSLDAGDGSSLLWLPQETILFDNSQLRRDFDIRLAASATLVALETVILGREAMGETVRKGSLHDRWRIRRDGDLVHADDLKIEIGGVNLASEALLGANRVLATLIRIADEDGETSNLLVDRIRNELTGYDGGATRMGGKIIVRLVAASGYEMRKRLFPVLALVLGEQPLPKVWRL